MRRPFIALFVTFAAAVVTAVTLAAQQPRIINGKMTSQAAGASFVQSFRSLVAAQRDVAWIGYAVPVKNRDSVMCCFWSGSSFISGNVSFSGGGNWQAAVCGLEPMQEADRRRAAPVGSAQGGPVKLEGSERMVVLVRAAEGQVDRIRTYSEECELDAGGRPVIWLEGVRPADSLALLETFLAPDAERKNRNSNAALAAIAMHADPAAGTLLERLARRHEGTAVRGEALFWMAQRGDGNAEQIISDALDKDESAAVRKKAVFALSQLKDDRGTQRLIQAARGNNDPAVRGEAIFWLGQKAGAKAAGAITDLIENDPDTEVKKRAVFALSQLPKDEGVPLLIKVAKTNHNPAVRKQAIFWLGQSRDPRALEFFAEILK
jgi:HEAT repeat protein